MNEKSLKSIGKILNHARKIASYSSKDEIWFEDDRTLEAVVFNLAQIGELVRFVDPDLQQKYPGINWAAMRGLRNRIIHDYDYINPLIIKSIAQRDIILLIKNLEQVMNENVQ